MSIWTRIGDALSALMDGEPLSEVFAKLTTPPEQSIGFTIAIIALGAKMAKADGQVTREEVAAFRTIFTIPPEDETHAARIFDLARTDVSGFEYYAAKIARMFGNRPDILTDLLDGLLHIAMADGKFHPGEDEFLLEVARIFGFSPSEFRTIKARHMQDVTDPYEVLGVSPGAGDQELRSHWRKLVRELHPDGMLARGVPLEAQKLAEQRLATVNEAYEMIMTERASV